jgi:hypothetical protein
VQLDLNEADKLKSSWILFYSHSAQSIYTQSEWHDAMLIKEIKLYKGVIKLVNEMLSEIMKGCWKLITKFETNAKACSVQ